MRRNPVRHQLTGLLLCGALLWTLPAGFAQLVPVPEPLEEETDASESALGAGDSAVEEPASSAPEENGLPEEPAPSAPEENGPPGEPSQPSDGEATEQSIPDDAAPESQTDEEQADLETRETLQLSDTEVVVYSFGELKKSLEEDNGITTYYLGADIIYATGGALIHQNKQHVVFDGTNPLDGPAVRYSITDCRTAAFTDTVRMNAATEAGRSITVRNLYMEGYNYYPPICVRDDIFYCDMYYENVEYHGPQFAFNRRGLVRLEDCDVTIVYTGAASAQELAEATEVRFAGSNVVRHSGDTRVIFFETTNGSIVLEEDAVLDITLTNRDMGLVYGYSSTLEVGRNASLLYTAPGRFNEGIFTKVEVMEGGLLEARCTGNPPDVVSIVSGEIIVREGGMLRIIGETRNMDRTLLRLTGNLTVEPGGGFQLVAEQGYNILMTVMGGGQLDFQDPHSVLLYNPVGVPFIFYGMQGGFSIGAQQINYWQAPAAYDNLPGGLDDPPQSSWQKADGSLFTVEATGNADMPPTYYALSSNYAPGDKPGYEPDPSNFSLANAGLIAFGRIAVEAEPLYEASLALSGWTDHPLAAVRADYTAWDAGYQEDGEADEAGLFLLNLLDTLPAGTEVLVRANRYGLTGENLVTVFPDNLSFAVPDSLAFGTLPLRGASVLAPRPEPMQVTVTDSRLGGGYWRLTVRLAQPFTPESASLPALRDALVFVDGLGNEVLLREDRHTPVAETEASVPGETVVLAWEPDQGILVRVPAGEGYAGERYHAVLHWSLTDAP